MHRVPILCFVALLIVPDGAWAQGEPLGPEFRVNTVWQYDQRNPSVALDSRGNFVVVWDSGLDSLLHFGVYGQRFASTGAPLGPQFLVITSGGQLEHLSPSVASDSSGNFVVAWSAGAGAYDAPFDVLAQRYASTGAPLGPQFRVNTSTTNSQCCPAVASHASGNFLVVWSGQGPGDLGGVFGQRYASTGEPLGPEFRVNTYTTNYQRSPVVASDSWGNFVVVWSSLGQDGSDSGIFGQRYASTGASLGPEFRVNT